MRRPPYQPLPKCRVRRLERSVTLAKQRAPRAVHGPPSLDTEAQIAVVRGLAPGAPSHTLLALEDRLLGRHGAVTRDVADQRYDSGLPTAPVHASLPAPPVHAASFRLRIAPASAFGETRFHVESFEEEPDSAQFVASNGATPGPQAPVDVLPTLPPIEVSIVTPPDVQMQRPRVRLQNANPLSPGSVQVVDVSSPIAADMLPAAASTRRAEAALNGEQQQLAEEFRRDLASMLGKAPHPTEDRQAARWDNALAQAQGQSANPQSAPTADATGRVEPTAPRGMSHDVFDRMNLGLGYANSFDLGAIDVTRRFDDLEHGLGLHRPAALAQAAPPTSAPPLITQPTSPDEMDVAADLAEIVAAQTPASVPASADEAATPPLANVPEETRHD